MSARKIIVGYDRSADATIAARWALDEASRTGAPVEFFYASEWPIWAPAASYVPTPAAWPDSETEQAIKAALNEAVTAAEQSHPTVRTWTALAANDAALELIRRSADASLVVLGSRGHSAVTNLLGSVSVAVSAHAHCPVVIVRGRPSTTTPVVVRFDGSPLSEAAPLRQACRQGGAWHAAGHRLLVSVNRSALQLAEPDLPAMIDEILDRTGLSPTALQLAITESTAVEGPKDILSRLADRGIQLAIDDFGTVHANLVVPSRLPITAVKLAGQLVAELNDADKHHSSRDRASHHPALPTTSFLVARPATGQAIAGLLTTTTPYPRTHGARRVGTQSVVLAATSTRRRPALRPQRHRALVAARNADRGRPDQGGSGHRRAGLSDHHVRCAVVAAVENGRHSAASGCSGGSRTAAGPVVVNRRWARG